METENVLAKKLELFRGEIDRLADDEISRLRAEAEEKSAARSRAESDRAAREAISDIRAESNARTAKFRKEISRLDFDTKKAVRMHRKELIEAFFADIEEETAKFSRSDKYDGYLKRAVAKAEEELGGKAVILAAPRDVDKVKALTSLKVEENAAIILGGICAKDEARGLYGDYTLDKALSDEREAFTEKSELLL